MKLIYIIRFICIKALVHSPLLSQIVMSEARKLYTIKILTKYINMKICFNKTIPTCKILHIIKNSKLFVVINK